MSQQKPDRRRLGDILVEAGLITPEQLQESLEYQRLWGHRLGTALVAQRFITEHELTEVLGRKLGLETADPLAFEIPPEVLKLVPARVCADNDLLPLGIRQVGGRQRLLVATSDPLNLDALQQVRAIARMDVDVVIAPMSRLAKAVHRSLGVMTAASRLPAFADSEMIIVQPGGKELHVGPEGVRETQPRGEHDTTHVPRRIPFPNQPSYDATRPGVPPFAAPTPVPMPNYPPYPGPYPAPFPGAMPGAMPMPMPMPGVPMHVAPMPTPMHGLPAMPPPHAGGPMTPPPPGPVASGAATVPSVPSAMGAVAATLPSVPSSMQAGAAAARGTVTIPVQVLNEIGRYAPKDLMLAIVRLLLKRGLVSADDLLAELKRVGG